MSIPSYETLQETVSDNLSYREDGSVAKCDALITALSRWLFLYATDESETGQGGSRQRHDGLNKTFQSELEAARRWRDAQPATSVATASSGYTKVDLSGGRE